MIVKFLKNKGGGSAGATIDYMLGKNRDREGAILLSGDPDLTARIADNLDFKNRYTVGVLSFEESNLEERQKQEIMQSFENTLLAGLERDQYDITWIEHRDKDRLELNFIIPKVDLHSGRAMNPYFDNVDRDLVNTWKNVTNHQYGLTNPDDPSKKQTHIIANDLPKDKKKLSESIGNSLMLKVKTLHAQGKSSNRQDVIQHIESLGLEIARVTPTAISIKSPNGGQNIRLKGEMYEESFRYDERYKEQRRADGEGFRKTFDESNQGEREKLSELTGKKRTFNEHRFSPKHEPHTEQDREGLYGNGRSNRAMAETERESGQGKNLDTNSSDYSSHGANNSSSSEFVVRQGNQEQTAGTSRIEPTNRANAFRTQNIGENQLSGGQEAFLPFNQAKSDSRAKFRGANPFDNSKIKSPFDNPFNRGFGDGDGLQRTELLKQPQATVQAKQTAQPQESENAKRLHESIQHHLEYVRKSVERAKRNKSVTDRANQRLERTERDIERTASYIDSTEQGIDQTKRGINETKQRAIVSVRATEQHLGKHEQEQKVRSHGMSR